MKLDVQRLLADVYADDRYGNTIDYSVSCDPPVSKADEEWAGDLPREAGFRP